MKESFPRHGACGLTPASQSGSNGVEDNSPGLDPGNGKRLRTIQPQRGVIHSASGIAKHILLPRNNHDSRNRIHPMVESGCAQAAPRATPDLHARSLWSIPFKDKPDPANRAESAISIRHHAETLLIDPGPCHEDHSAAEPDRSQLELGVR